MWGRRDQYTLPVASASILPLLPGLRWRQAMKGWLLGMVLLTGEAINGLDSPLLIALVFSTRFSLYAALPCR